jgi:hypothetical protein
METIHKNNRLSEHASDFFNRLRNYLDTKLYFYGSILRTDYLPGQSDIDVDIFTDNEAQIISQMSAFLHIPKQKFKKIILRSSSSKLNNNLFQNGSPSSNLIHGHKVTYYDMDNSLKVEFSIYNEKNKREILMVHLSKSNLPIHASFLLWILKILFYHLQLISTENYRFLKHNTLSLLIGIPETDFVKI